MRYWQCMCTVSSAKHWLYILVYPESLSDQKNTFRSKYHANLSNWKLLTQRLKQQTLSYGFYHHTFSFAQTQFVFMYLCKLWILSSKPSSKFLIPKQNRKQEITKTWETNHKNLKTTKTIQTTHAIYWPHWTQPHLNLKTITSSVHW